MDLIALFKKSIKDPLHFSHLFVIFVTIFIFLIIGLSMASILSTINHQIQKTSACDSQTHRNISGKARKDNDTVFYLNYSGNSQCFLSAFVSWKDTASRIEFWLYDPLGNVTIVEPKADQTYNLVYSTAPVNKGTWRLVLKTDSDKVVGFSGEIAVK